MKILVTRHPALKVFLEEDLGQQFDVVFEHVTLSDIDGHEVWGVLPLHLAAAASKVVVVTLAIPPALRGVELTITQVRDLFRGVKAFSVKGVTV